MIEGLSDSLIYLAGIFYLCCLASVTPQVRIFWVQTFSMPTPTTSIQFGSLDGMRGIAALWVALFHVTTWSGAVGGPLGDIFPILLHGDSAVPVFTVLSGFLIYRSFRKVKDISDLKNYFIRRFMRIYPLYFATTIALFTWFLPISEESPINRLLAEILMLRTLGFETFANPASWSLYVEVLFYITLPVFVLLTGRLTTLFSIIFLLLTSLAAIHGGYEVNLQKYFLMGIITSKILDKIGEFAILSEIIAALGFISLYFSSLGDWLFEIFRNTFVDNINIYSLFKEGNAPHLSFVTGFSTMLIILGLLKSRLLGTILSCTALRMLGAVSYSVFLIHPLLIFATMNVAPTFDRTTTTVGSLPDVPIWFIPFIFVPALLTVSAAAFLLLEKPFLGVKRDLNLSTTPQHTQ